MGAAALLDPPKVLKGNPGVLVKAPVYETNGNYAIVEFLVAPEVAYQPLKFAKLLEEEAKAAYEDMKAHQKYLKPAPYQFVQSWQTAVTSPALSPEEAKCQALDWVNMLRTEWGMEPLKALPQGTPKSTRNCAIARALGAVTVGGAMATMPGGRQYAIPPEVSTFIAHFDSGNYPELIERGTPARY